MAIRGKAALAMWWDMRAETRADFEHWHSHEHFPERLAIPGFRRATRWRAADGGEGIFVMYELDSYAVLSSPHYLERLNAPTPWSTRMMPHHRNMVRSQCSVLASHGGTVAGHALTVRMSPALPGEGDALRERLVPLLAQWPVCAGLAGAHLLRHSAPPIAATTEQKIRGGDSVADWVVVVTGYDAAALAALAGAELGEAALLDMGAAPGAIHGFYRLAHSATPTDMV